MTAFLPKQGRGIPRASFSQKAKHNCLLEANQWGMSALKQIPDKAAILHPPQPPLSMLALEVMLLSMFSSAIKPAKPRH